MLQPGYPTALHAFANGLVVHVTQRNLLVRLVGSPQSCTQISGGAGSGSRGWIGAVVTLDLGKQAAGPRLSALVVDQVTDSEIVLAALEGKALDVADPGFAEAQIDYQLVFALVQAVAVCFAAVQRTASGTCIRAVGAGQAALGQVGTLVTVIEQLERHVLVLQAARKLRQAQLNHITAKRIDGQSEYVGLHIDQRGIGADRGLRNHGAFSTGRRYISRSLTCCGGVRQSAGRSTGGGLCSRHDWLAVVLVPLENHQVGHDCQGDDQDRALDIHDYSAIEEDLEVGAAGTGS